MFSLLSPSHLSIAAAIAAGIALTSCIAYDKDIRVQSEDFNPSPVRIVEAVFVSQEANLACQEAAQTDLDECPVAQPIRDQLPHILDPQRDARYQFCSCKAPLRHDKITLPQFSIRLEDQDENDRLYAVMLLDSDQSNIDGVIPNDETYSDYLHPHQALPEDKSSAYGRDAINRPLPIIRILKLGQASGTLDLCNGKVGNPIEPGWHTFSIVATDRPWFRYADIPQPGVPDIASGATHDAVHFSFYCEAESEEGATGCKCDKNPDLE
jgi:hypothetical protein